MQHRLVPNELYGRLLLGAEYNRPRCFRREPWNKRSNKITGVRVFWGTVEASNRWKKGMPFRVKLFHKIHTMVPHEGIGGESKCWQTAYRRLQTHMAMWPDIQKEWY